MGFLEELNKSKMTIIKIRKEIYSDSNIKTVK